MDETQILSSILWVSELISSKTDLDELLQLIVELTPKLINLNRCSIWLWDAEEKEFIPRISYSPENEVRDEHLAAFYSLKIKSDEIPEISRKLLNEKVPVVISNAERNPMFPKKYAEFFQIKSMLLIPLLCGAEYIGTMVLDYRKEFHHFTQKEIRVAMGLSTHAAMAIKNAQLISSLKQERNFSRDIIETIGDGLLVIKPDRRVIIANNEMERLTGLSRQEILGLNCSTVFNGGLATDEVNMCNSICPLEDNTISAKTSYIRGSMKARDGRKLWLSSKYSHAHDLEGNLLYTVITVRDTTDKIQMEDRINHLYSRLRIDRVGLGNDEEMRKGGF
jgi:PAS domain S-box-containing protein